MNFSLRFYGEPGSIGATLSIKDEDGTFAFVADETGLKNARAARKWGKQTANKFRAATVAPDLHTHAVVVSGTSNFTL